MMMNKTTIILIIVAMAIIPLIVKADLIDVNGGGGSEVIIDPFGSSEISFWTGIPAEEPPAHGGGPSGGGGGQGQIEKNATAPQVDLAIKNCLAMNGTTVGIKGGIFCLVNGTYIPIEDLMPAKQVTILGITMDDYGAMLVKDAPLMGWLAIVIMVTVIILAIKDVAENTKERRKRRVLAEEREREMAQERERDRRRWRPDGGYY